MITQLSERLYTWAKGWRVLASLVAFMALILMPPLADPDLLSQSLDGMFFYTPERAFSAIASYGEAGRTQMMWVHVADFLIILVYTSMFCLSISWLLQRGFEPAHKMRRLNVLPLLGGLFDVLENLCVMTLILVYPARPVALAWLSTAFTTSKYSSILLILLPLLIGLVKAGMNRFKVQHPDQESFAQSIITHQISELKQSILNLRLDLQEYEKKYQLSTEDFYRRFTQGNTDDREDYIIWAGAYEMLRDNEERLREMQ